MLCVLLPLNAAAQNSATLSGTVTDTAGAVVVGATVKALNLGNNREITITTDSSGKYEFTNLTVGSYRISAGNQGFATNAESIVVKEGANESADFTLAPGTIQDTVTVTAGKGNARLAVEVPQTVTVTTAEDIERQRPRSTFEAIERAPNIIVRETNPARERPRLRGLDSSRVLIVIDGERLNNARTDLQTGLSPSIIDVTQLDSAEVVAGAGSSLYGSDSLAGTINLITKGPTRPDTGVLLGFRLDGNLSTNGRVRRANGVVNLSNKRAAFRVSGSIFRNDNYKIGNRAISIEEVLAIGRFFITIPSSLPNAAGSFSVNGPNSYPVFSVPENGEILNGEGHGFNDQFDFWLYPSEKHNIRARYIGSRHKDLRDAFSGPPYEGAQRSNPFRDYDKFGLRYEGLDLSKYVPRLAVNIYRQRLSFPQQDLTYANAAATSLAAGNGSFFTPPPIAGVPQPTVFTGSPSRFTLSNLTVNTNTIVTHNIDAQATLAPVVGLFVTVGAQRLIDNSSDAFLNYPFLNNQPNLAAGQSGASSPNTRYEDRAAFFQAEFNRYKYLVLSGGLRVDNWRTKASPSPQFPLRFESAILAAATPALQANPGALASQVSSLPSLVALGNRTATVETSNTTVTGSFGAVFRLPYGINPYIRYGTSYREPSITERYLIRNFSAFPGLVPIVVGNPGLEPETGRTLDVGVKAQGKNFTASFGYFRNDLKNLIIFQTPDFGNICVAPNPSIGLLPLSAIFVNSARPCAIGQSAINFNGRINQADNLITGFEGTGEYSFSLGNAGSINPFVSFGALKGTNKSPTPLRIFQLETLLARTDSPIELSGSRDDFPLGNITPFRMIGGARYSDLAGRFFAEYSFRTQKRVTRVDPNSLTGTTLVNYGTFASLDGFTKHDLRAGYTIRNGERYRISLNAGIQNFTDKLFFEQFQNAPAPGRSFIFGFTTEFFNLLRK